MIAMLDFGDGTGATLQNDGSWLIDDAVPEIVQDILMLHRAEVLLDPITGSVRDRLDDLAGELDAVVTYPQTVAQPSDPDDPIDY